MASERKFFIWIDPDKFETNGGVLQATQYVLDVRSVLVRMESSRVGCALLNSIRWHGMQVRIAPKANRVAADETWGENQDLQYNRSKGGLPHRESRFKPPQFRPVRSVIRFSPEFCPDGGSCQTDFLATHEFIPTAESVLFHEMIHSLRNISKRFLSWPLHGGLKGFSNREEFNAVLFANIFDSEIGGELRGSYPDFTKLDKAFAGSTEFYGLSRQTFDLVSSFCNENKGFAGAVAKIPVKFNPVRAFFQDPKKVREIAEKEGSKRD